MSQKKERGRVLFVADTKVAMRAPDGTFNPVRRHVLHCLVLGHRKRIVAYGSAIRLPQDPPDIERAALIAEGRAAKALRKKRTVYHYYFPLPSYAFAERGNAVPFSVLGKTALKAVKKARKQDLKPI